MKKQIKPRILLMLDIPSYIKVGYKVYSRYLYMDAYDSRYGTDYRNVICFYHKSIIALGISVSDLKNLDNLGCKECGDYDYMYCQKLKL